VLALRRCSRQLSGHMARAVLSASVACIDAMQWQNVSTAQTHATQIDACARSSRMNVKTRTTKSDVCASLQLVRVWLRVCWSSACRGHSLAKSQLLATVVWRLCTTVANNSACENVPASMCW
jgi:hypothetical protein